MLHQQPSFKVYNASAGSGKTFNLVKAYLKIILTSSNIFAFQNILAVTFTNKAAAEMKERVLENLQAFAEGNQTDMSALILKETNLAPDTLKTRSKVVLQTILQNYSAFAITTIDSFTHKIIKSFAYDLNLPLNFEVQMDAATLLNEAVDVLISKIGSDKALTNLLISYSVDKIDQDKSWDITKDLSEFSKTLLKEDYVKKFRQLADKSLNDFFELKQTLQSINKTIEKEFETLADTVLEFINTHNIALSDFSYSGEYPKHFKKFKKISVLKSVEFNPTGRLNKTIEDDKNLYAAKASAEGKQILDSLKPELQAFYNKSKVLYLEKYPNYLLHKNVLNSIIPLAVLNKINTELETIKVDNNIRLNAEFNQLISDKIKNEPAPFIYERIGQKFTHYFIDEMQDTSVLQWQNLKPLIANALAQENSSLLLVGDGKQAIYRWRGSKVEQFIALGDNKNNTFSVPKTIENLETNFRSFSEIIQFNNSFFTHVSGLLNNSTHQSLYLSGNAQKENAKKGGFVSLDFLEDEDNKELNVLKIPKRVHEHIVNLQKEFALSDICIITRTKKQGVAIADYLTAQGVSITSSETLLLKNDAKVQFIIDVLYVIEFAQDKERKLDVLYFLHTHLNLEVSKHQFLKDNLETNNAVFFKNFEQYGVVFSFLQFQQISLYEKVELIIRTFNLTSKANAYLQFFLDVVLEQQRLASSVTEFLDFWNLNEGKLSIVASENEDAVQIMTIHKSKGLEFPVVILPFDVSIYKEINPKVWLGNLPKLYNGFEALMIPGGNDLKLINETSLDIYNTKREALELDSFNLLYVVLTRAQEQLYVVTEASISKKGEEKNNLYSSVFINYLKVEGLWQDGILNYTFGDFKRVSTKKEAQDATVINNTFITSSWQDHNITMLASASKLWDTDVGKAIDYGNLLHEILAKIKTVKDVDVVVHQYEQQGLINTIDTANIKAIILQVVNHTQLKSYFLPSVKVYTERELVGTDNQLIIPDRLVFLETNTVVIIDYKTGSPSESHHLQLNNYANVLKRIGYNVHKKILVYLNKKIAIVEV